MAIVDRAVCSSRILRIHTCRILVVLGAWRLLAAAHTELSNR